MYTTRLPPLAVGHHVRIQNQTGPHPNKWDKTGIIIEVRQFDQYVLRIDGSGRITLCNRKFLRRYVPIKAPQPQCTIYDDFSHITQLPAKPAASPTQRPTTCLPTTPTSNQPTLEPTHSQSPTSTVPTIAAPAHLSPSYPETAVNTPSCPLTEPPLLPEAFAEPHQPITTPPSNPEGPLALTPPMPKRQPPRQHWHWGDSWTEQWTMNRGPWTFASLLPLCYVTLSVFIAFFYLVLLQIRTLKT